MKKFLLLLLTVAAIQLSSAQVIRDNKKTLPTKKDAVLKAASEIILYEDANFNGRFLSLKPGNYPLPEFNDMVSSIQVPAGFIVIIYEHANEKGGYGTYIDLMEDCADLSQYNFNDIVSYVRIVSISSRPGFVWARNRIKNNEFIAGHWERVRANGAMPDNSLPAVASSLSSSGYPDDYTYAPMATPAEINEFNDIQKNQLGIAVLGGETTQPIYYHHNKPGEQVYKYDKLIDPARLPGKFLDWVHDKLGWAGIAITPFEVAADLTLDIKDWIFGSSSTKMNIDCWYPDSEFRTTVCGKMKDDAFICSQDYIHTQVTVDKDVCMELIPSDRFKFMLTNRHAGDAFDHIEGEVKAKNLVNYNPRTRKSRETLNPHNPLLMEIKTNENVCFYGPWMADILDLNGKAPIPFTNEKIELVNIDLRNNNEIHPINQLWRRKGDELILTAIVDETGYFKIRGNNEVSASGLGQRMSFYIAFLLPANQAVTSGTREYNVDGVGFDFTDYPVSDIQPVFLTFRYQGSIRLKVNDNMLVRNQKTHTVSFDKVRKRADGSIQGYIIVETEPIVKPGGSINIIVKEMGQNSVIDKDRLPVRERQ